MRGYRLLGSIGSNWMSKVDGSDLVALSWSEDFHSMRAGLVRVRDFDQYVRGEIPTACTSDFVWVVTTIGEHAFKPRSQDTAS